MYRVPSIIRSDRGGENMMVILINGEDRYSHILGRSVHNNTCALEKYYKTFSIMEERGILDVEDKVGIAVLHFICLHAINKHLLQFQEAP